MHSRVDGLSSLVSDTFYKDMRKPTHANKIEASTNVLIISDRRPSSPDHSSSTPASPEYQSHALLPAPLLSSAWSQS